MAIALEVQSENHTFQFVWSKLQQQQGSGPDSQCTDAAACRCWMPHLAVVCKRYKSTFATLTEVVHQALLARKLSHVQVAETLEDAVQEAQKTFGISPNLLLVCLPTTGAIAKPGSQQHVFFDAMPWTMDWLYARRTLLQLHTTALQLLWARPHQTALQIVSDVFI